MTPPDFFRPDLVIVAIGGLGDLLLLTPFIRHFRETGRYHKIHCLCPTRALQLFDHNPCIDQVISCQANERLFWTIPQENREVFSPFQRFRVESQPPGEARIVVSSGVNPGRGHWPAIEAISRQSRIHLRSHRMEIFTTRRDRIAAARICARAGGRRVVLVNFESVLKEKNLPVCLRRGIRRRLRRAGLVLFEVSGNRLRVGRSKLPLPGLRTMSELAKRCSVILTVDSFLGHLATAVGTRAVVLFGPSNPAVYGHPANQNLRPAACVPCGGTARRRKCPAPLCMSAFRPDLVAAAAIQLAASQPLPAKTPGPPAPLLPACTEEPSPSEHETRT